MVRSAAAERRRAARRRLDRGAENLRALVPSAAVPTGGWVAAIRTALGMAAADLGHRIGIDESNVLRLEQNERAGVLRLDTLRRAADGLECDLVYVLVPRRPLAEMVEEQARAKAAAFLAPIEHSMRLEGQQVDPAVTAAHLDDLAAKLVDKPALWRSE